MAIDVGGTYRAALLVSDPVTQLPANANTVTLTITTPDQVAHVVNPVNPPAQEGVYIFDYVMTQAGLHRFDWLTTGPGAAQTDYESARNFRALGSLAAARAYLSIVDTGKDQSIRSCMAAATRATERIVGTCVIRQFTDFIGGSWRDVIGLVNGPLVSATSVTSVTSVWDGGPSWQLSDMVVNPEAATLRLRSWLPFWFGPWNVIYTAGRTEIPEDIVTGYHEILWDLWATQRGTLTDQQDPDLAEVASFEIGPTYQPPGRALQYLEGERRHGFG